MKYLQQYLLWFDGLSGCENVRIMLSLKDAIQHFELLLGEKVSSHLFPKKISAWERMAIWYWRFLNTFQRGERRGKISSLTM